MGLVAIAGLIICGPRKCPLGDLIWDRCEAVAGWDAPQGNPGGLKGRDAWSAVLLGGYA